MDAFVGAHFATWQTMWQRCSVGVEPLKHFSSLLYYPPPEISVSPATASVALGRTRFVFVSGGPAHNPLRFITPERLVQPFKRCRDVLLGQQRIDGQTVAHFAPGDGFCRANGTGSKWFGFEAPVFCFGTGDKKWLFFLVLCPPLFTFSPSFVLPFHIPLSRLPLFFPHSLPFFFSAIFSFIQLVWQQVYVLWYIYLEFIITTPSRTILMDLE